MTLLSIKRLLSDDCDTEPKRHCIIASSTHLEDVPQCTKPEPDSELEDGSLCA